MSPWLRRRLVVDRVVAAVLLAILSPIIAVLAAAVRRNDGGPAFVAVPRVGQGGRSIGMWKLRTMRAETADGRAAGTALTAAHDDRITQVGRRLRAHHLDELPQLYNVVRGEMGLLGPRPEAPEFVDRRDAQWAAVLEAPPGIAGPTQLVVEVWETERITAVPDGSAYVAEVLPVKLAIDRWYVTHSSLRLDALVVATLLRRIASGGGAQSLDTLVRAQVQEAQRVLT